MATVNVSALGVQIGDRDLFTDVSFKLEPRERMTLSGRNGAGKSTLLRVLAGEMTPNEGKLVLRKGARVALHDQRPPRASATTLGDYVFESRAEMIEAEAELTRLEGEMASGDADAMQAYADAQQHFEHGGGYRWRDQVQAVLNGLGFTAEQRERPLSSFSGGELTRASLARALAMRPDLLLLDEPTNHLDIPTLEWLESYLIDLDATVVLVAHDRWFLEAVGTSVLELEAGRGRYFNGPWHSWRKEQAAREMALGKAIDRQKAEIERMERFVERFRYKASKAKQAQSRVKMIERKQADGPSRDPRDTRTLRFQFAEPVRTGRNVLQMKNGTVEVPGRVLLDGADLLVERGEHVVLIGPNGSGKTSLIETLAGRREPAAGMVHVGEKVKVGYLSQHADTAAGDGTVLDAVQRETGLPANKARALLGLFLFSGADAMKSLGAISGGEQRRLSIAILVAGGANLLILDEPTNHLDVESREALEDALSAFKGAVVLISHDRALLEAVGSRTIVFEDGSLRSYPMGWAEYQVNKEEREAAAEELAGAGKGNGAGAARGNGTGAGKGNGAGPGKGKEKSKAPSGPSKNARKKAQGLEASIERAETELREIEADLADPAAWSSPTSSKRSTERHEAAKKAVAELYAQLESVEV